MTFEADRPQIKVRVLELCEETGTRIAGGRAVLQHKAESCPPDSCVGALALSTLECDHIWRWESSVK